MSGQQKTRGFKQSLKERYELSSITGTWWDARSHKFVQNDGIIDHGTFASRSAVNIHKLERIHYRCLRIA